MGVRRLLRAGALAAALAAGLSLAVTAVATAFLLAPAAPSGAAIVVLGGAQFNGLPDAQTRARVDRAVALWQAGAAPLLVMTGGAPDDGRPATGALMAARARIAGVPMAALRVEDGSHSTLQNALFSRPLLPGGKVILVSHRYHLPRAWASFRWAGIGPVQLVPAQARAADGRLWLRSKDPWLEAAKWPLNVARAALASALRLVGIAPVRLGPLLA